MNLIIAGPPVEKRGLQPTGYDFERRTAQSLCSARKIDPRDGVRFACSSPRPAIREPQEALRLDLPRRAVLTTLYLMKKTPRCSRLGCGWADVRTGRVRRTPFKGARSQATLESAASRLLAQ